MRTRLNLIRTGYQIPQAMEGCSFESKLRVFVSKAVHLYGCCTWKFTEESLAILEDAWRKVLKSSRGLPIRTHTSILHSLTKSDPICDTVHRRNIKFIDSLSRHSNASVVTLLHYAKLDIRSVLGHNCYAVEHFLPKNLNASDNHSAFEVWDILNNPFSCHVVPGFNRRELFSVLQAMVT